MTDDRGSGVPEGPPARPATRRRFGSTLPRRTLEKTGSTPPAGVEPAVSPPTWALADRPAASAVESGVDASEAEQLRKYSAQFEALWDAAAAGPVGTEDRYIDGPADLEPVDLEPADLELGNPAADPIADPAADPIADAAADDMEPAPPATVYGPSLNPVNRGSHLGHRLVGAPMVAAIILVLALVGVGIGIVVSTSHTSKPAVSGGDRAGEPSAGGAANGSAVSSGAPGAEPGSAGSSAIPSAGAGGVSDAPEPLARQRELLNAWIGANLSRAAVVVADPATVSALKLAGFSNARSDTALAGIDRQGVDYLVSVPTADTQSTERNQLAEASARLAIFSAGTDAVSISQVFPGGAADLAQRRANNLNARQIAATQLPANPDVQFMGTTKSVIQTANVDLRAMTVLVVLGQQGMVWVREVSLDAAETRAGQPARTLTITVENSQTAQTILSALPVLYRPLGIVAVSPGTLRLTWAPAVAPVVTDG